MAAPFPRTPARSLRCSVQRFLPRRKPGGGTINLGISKEAFHPSQISIDAASTVSVNTQSGPGGNINVNADTFINNGLLSANGGLGGAITINATDIMQTGTIVAQGTQGNGGTINVSFTDIFQSSATSLMSAASDTSMGGIIHIEGSDNASLIATGAFISDGAIAGGAIDLLAGNEVWLLGAFLSARGGSSGGLVRIGGDYVGTTGTRRPKTTEVDQNTLILADAMNNGDGGQITISGTNIFFAGQASAQGGPNGGSGGSITLFAPGSNAVAGNDAADKTGQATSTVQDFGTLEASGYGSGGTGGNITVLGDNVGIMSGALLDASGDAGGGYIKIGGDFHGAGTTPTALNTYVDANALIMANANTTGNGGNVVVWSDGNTWFEGNIMAEGGALSGNGGFVETSGHDYLDAGGYVDLLALNGQKGTYLLDPSTIEIYGAVTPAFNATDSSISLSSSLVMWLDASDTSKVTLTYESTGTTASGTSGTNTITVGSNSGLKVGERIQLGGSSDSYAASINDNNADGVYTITAISGTTVTLDANLGSTYSGSTLYGGFVSQLTDKSGNGNNATQATAADMPLWISNGQNAIGVAQFDGNVDFLSFPTTGFPSGNHALTFSAWVDYFGNGTSNVNVIAAYGNDAGGGNKSPTFSLGSSDKLDLDFGSGTGEAQTSTLTANTGYDVSTIYNGSNTTVYLNNALQATTTYSSANISITDNNGANTGAIGAFLSSFGGVGSGATKRYGTFDGYISDVTLYSTALSTNAQALIAQYESAKYGTALTGPGNATGESGLTGTEAQKAMASTQAGATTDGYSVFSDQYLARLSATSNIILEASGNITIDLQGDNMSLTAGRNLSITSTTGSITNNSSGTITTSQSASTGGNITFSAGTDIVLSGLTLNSNGGNIILDANTANGGGAISLTSSSAINSSGGAITLGGNETTPSNIVAGTGYAVGDASYAVGINLNASTINSGSGSIHHQRPGVWQWHEYCQCLRHLHQRARTVQATGSGNITLNGTGGGSGNGSSNIGVLVKNTSTVSVATGTITANGTGGTTTGGGNSGFAMSGQRHELCKGNELRGHHQYYRHPGQGSGCSCGSNNY